MSTVLRIDTEIIHEVGGRLSSVSHTLERAKVPAGNALVPSGSIYLPTLHLKSIGGNVSEVSLAGWLGQCSNLINRLSLHADALGYSVRQAALTFERTERSLYFSTILPVPSEGSGIVGEISDAMEKILQWLKASDGTSPPFDWFSGGLLNQALIALSTDPANALEYLKGIVTDKILEATSASGNIGVEGSLYSTGFSNAYGGGELTIGAYEAGASYNAMLFTKDENGNLVLNPSLDASVGFSYTLLSASANQSVELAPGVSAGIGGDVTVGKVDAEVKASVGLFNPDGTLNPRAKLEASAEATLVEANARANVDVLGVNTTVEGGVTVGVGGHADFGYSDGVVSADVGASLGVGFSLKVEIDVGGAVDAAKGVCESIGKKLFSWLP